MPTKILLISTVKWPSLARYAGGFVAAGCHVEALAPAGAPAFLSRYVSRTFNYDGFSPIACLRNVMERAAPDLIVACDDRAVHQLVLLHGREQSQQPDSSIASLITRSLGDISIYPKLLSRVGSLTALSAAGALVPETYAVECETDLEAKLELLGFPAVLKSDGSWGGDGVAIVHSKDEALSNFRRLAGAPSRLRSLVRAARRRDPHYLADALSPKGAAVCVQRFIGGYPAASAFAAWQGNMVGSIYYDVLVADGVIGPPNVIKRVNCPQMELASRAAARIFGLSGLHGIDFIRDEKGDAYVLEINPRATQGGTLAFGVGQDLPAALAGAFSNTVTGMRPPIGNDIVAFFPREWRRDPCSKYLEIGYHDVPWDDPSVLQAALKG